LIFLPKWAFEKTSHGKNAVPDGWKTKIFQKNQFSPDGKSLSALMENMANHADSLHFEND
jgi:hypothetical protein